MAEEPDPRAEMRLTEVTWELAAELWWVGVEDLGVLIPLVCPYLSHSEAA